MKKEDASSLKKAVNYMIKKLTESKNATGFFNEDTFSLLNHPSKNEFWYLSLRFHRNPCHYGISYIVKILHNKSQI